MPKPRASTRVIISDYHAALGRELRQLRVGAGKTLRNLGQYGSGYLSSIENGFDKCSRKVVEYYLDTCGGDRARLMNLFDAADRYSAEQRQQQRDARHTEEAEQHELPPPSGDEAKPYVIVSEDAFYTLDDRGVMTDCKNTFTIRAIQPGVNGFMRTVTYEADKRPGVITVEARMGCKVTTLGESDTGAVKLFAEFDRALNPSDSDPYSFSYATKVSSTQRAYPVVAYQTITTRVQQSAAHVQFSNVMPPKSIWWFACPTLTEVSIPRPERMFEVNESGYYFHRFDNIAPQWLYGIAWTWGE